MVDGSSVFYRDSTAYCYSHSSTMVLLSKMRTLSVRTRVVEQCEPAHLHPFGEQPCLLQSL